MAARKEKYRRRQREVFDAAAALFAEKGYHGASTSDIAARLGIKQGSLYYYFESKEEALEQVCLFGVAGFVQRMDEILAADTSLSDKVRATVHGHLGTLRERREYMIVFLEDRDKLPRERRRRITDQAHEYERKVERLFALGVAENRFAAGLDCRLAALALIGLCNSVAGWHDTQPRMALGAIADAYADLILHGVTVRPS